MWEKEKNPMCVGLEHAKFITVIGQFQKQIFSKGNGKFEAENKHWATMEWEKREISQ